MLKICFEKEDNYHDERATRGSKNQRILNIKTICYIPLGAADDDDDAVAVVLQTHSKQGNNLRHETFSKISRTNILISLPPPHKLLTYNHSLSLSLSLS